MLTGVIRTGHPRYDAPPSALRGTVPSPAAHASSQVTTVITHPEPTHGDMELPAPPRAGARATRPVIVKSFTRPIGPGY